jgi:hypothetical protein
MSNSADMYSKNSYITSTDIESKLQEIQDETEEISEPSLVSRRLVMAGTAVIVLTAIYFLGKQRGQGTKTFVEVVRL